MNERRHTRQSDEQYYRMVEDLRIGPKQKLPSFNFKPFKHQPMESRYANV